MPVPFLPRVAKRVIEDREGAAVIELALVLPVLMFMLAGMIDISRYVSAAIDVEQAAQRTTAYALGIPLDSTSTSALATEAASAAGVSKSNVTAELYRECDGVRQAKFATPCTTGQTSALYVHVSIKRQVAFQFDWAALGSMMGMTSMGSNITVTGDSLVRKQ